MKAPKTILPAGALLSALVLTSCTGEPDGSADGDDEVITIATQRQPHLYAPYVYEDFAPEGVTIEVVPMDNSTDQVQALISGDVDFALTGVPTVITSVSQGEDVTLIGSGANGGSGLIGDAEIDGVEDLEGRQVAHVPGSSQEMALRVLLEEAGLDPDSDVDLVNLGYADMYDSLSAGDVDAFAGAEVGVSLAQLDGFEAVDDIYETPLGAVNIGFATTGSLVEEDPELVSDILDIHAQAIEHLLENEDEWIAGTVEQFGFEEEVLEEAVQNIWLRSEIDDEYRSNMEALTENMLELDVISEAPAVDDVISEVD